MARKTTPRQPAADPPRPKALRLHAEARLRAKARRPLTRAEDNPKTVLQELRVHQMELEIQNEELRGAQVELAQSRDRYTDLYEFAPAGYLTLDAKGVIHEANLTAATLLDTERGKLLGRRFSHFVTQASQAPLFLHGQKLFASSTREIAEVHLRGSAKDPRVVELQSFLRADEAGGTPSWRMALLDVSARKQAELRQAALNVELAQRTIEVRERTDQLAGIIGSAWDAIISMDHERRIMLFNAAAETMFGWTADQIIGQSLDLLLPTGGREAHRAQLNPFEADPAATLALNRPFTLSGRRRDGTSIPIEASISKVEMAGRSIFTVIMRDITDRLQLECEILAIAERERERIGHDLHDDVCQQLVAIEFQNETLINEWAAAAPASVAKGREISALVRGLIAHARELARGLSPNLNFESDGLMAALRELAERTARVFKCTCQFECAIPVFIRDETKYTHLYRIAQEAVGNAVKHAQASSITIQLQAAERGIVLGIVDNGIGIPAGPPAREGVGMRIMQYRANLLGGSLTVQQAGERGTAVICRLDDIHSAPPHPAASA